MELEGQMRPWALYHDIDELKCEVIREAIKARAITDGEVICGDIKQVDPEQLLGFRRVHFFAGGGFWDLALNYAGWGDRPVWTGSCPCPSFSSAGKGGGFDDPRHLWPDWFKLIRERRPPVVFGEQADAAVGFGWVDLVQTDLEASSYAFGKVVFGAHSVGAPHIRQRLYFVGECANAQESKWRRTERAEYGGGRPQEVGGSSAALHCPHPDGRHTSNGDIQRSGEQRLFAQDSSVGEHNHSFRYGRRAIRKHDAEHEWKLTNSTVQTGVEIDAVRKGLQGLSGNERDWRGPGWLDPQQARSIAASGANRGFWKDCDWWYGRDGRYRPIGPGLQPLAHGSPARVGRLRLYDDGIVVAQAAEFIKAYKES